MSSIIFQFRSLFRFYLSEMFRGTIYPSYQSENSFKRIGAMRAGSEKPNFPLTSLNHALKQMARIENRKLLCCQPTCQPSNGTQMKAGPVVVK